MNARFFARFIGVVILMATFGFLLIGGVSAQTGVIEDVWLGHNAVRNGQSGLVIHTRFNVYDMLGEDGRVVAYFQFANGVDLNDYNGRYTTTNGIVSVGDTFVPAYQAATYNNFELFIPYDEFHFNSGVHELRLYVIVFGEYAQNYSELDRSGYVYFTFNTGANGGGNDGGPPGGGAGGVITPTPVQSLARLLNGGRGLTNGAAMNNGEFQVEGYCGSQSVSENGTNWFCGGRALTQADFDQICRQTYNLSTAFALQNGPGAKATHRWRCYSY